MGAPVSEKAGAGTPCPANARDMLVCMDGTEVSLRFGCAGRGGRAQCPSGHPFMCQNQICGKDGDHCCATATAYCGVVKGRDHGGILTKCPSYSPHAKTSVTEAPATKAPAVSVPVSVAKGAKGSKTETTHQKPAAA